MYGIIHKTSTSCPSRGWVGGAAAWLTAAAAAAPSPELIDSNTRKLRRRRLMAMSLMAAQTVQAQQMMDRGESERMWVFLVLKSKEGRRDMANIVVVGLRRFMVKMKKTILGRGASSIQGEG